MTDRKIDSGTVTLQQAYKAGRRVAMMDASCYQGSQGFYSEGYRMDANTRRRQREAFLRLRAERLLAWDTVIPAGRYGRIEITDTGEIYFCAGQYAPTEYYYHLCELCRLLIHKRSN